MKVLIVAPEKTPYEAEIDDSLSSMQKVVGGFIEAVYPYAEPVALVCNEEGKMEGLPLNRTLRDESGAVYDIVAGTFFVCGLSEDNFSSLSPEHIEKFKKEFQDPEMFMKIGDKITAMKTTEKQPHSNKQPMEHDGLER